MDPLHIQYIHQAGLQGLGAYRIDKISIVGEKLDNVISPFHPHRLYRRAQFTSDQIKLLKNQCS